MRIIIGKAALIFTACLVTLFLFLHGNRTVPPPQPPAVKNDAPAEQPKSHFQEITGVIKKGETLFDIFKKHELDLSELYKMKEASASVHKLRELYPGRQYKIIRDDDEQIRSFRYWIDDTCFLNVSRGEEGYCAEKIPIPYDKRILHIGGSIKDNLISSLGEGNNNLLLALQLSDIFAWDIDFSTDLRADDSYKIVVEGLYEDGDFKKYGNILSAEFINKDDAYRAYAFEQAGKVDYYDEKGRSLRKAFLKAPLSFRRISSQYSKRRFNPVLKIYRPHHGLDYAAARGTPVSAAGDGKVLFAGPRGQYGNLVILRHRNGYKTYYGHMSKFAKIARRGAKIKQGDIIGYVGATGLATGPHLHYEMRIHDRPVNPLSVKIPRGESIPGKLMASFTQFKNDMNGELAASEFSGSVASKTTVELNTAPKEG